MIKWEIYECNRGGFTAQLVGRPEPNTPAEFKPGYYMGGIIYESAHFDTQKQAEAYVNKKQNKR